MSDVSHETRATLARRRLLLAFDKRGETMGERTTLEGVVKAAAKIIEREPRDFIAPEDCAEHWWTEWRLNPLGYPREERFCFECGSMEHQEIRTGPSGRSSE